METHSFQAEHNVKTIFTTEEIVLNGFNCGSFDLPDAVKCKFCGKTLFYEGIVFIGTVMAVSPLPQRCTCNEAVKFWQRKDEHDRQKAEAERLNILNAANQAKIDWLIKNSRIKKRFLSCTFDTYKVDKSNESQVKAFRVAKDYADTFANAYKSGKGLYFEGTCGTGKTHLATAIALRVIDRGYSVICQSSFDMLEEIKNTYDSFPDCTEGEAISRYRNANLLIIDDLGKEFCTRWTMSVLYGVLNDRYEQMRPTIITTNYNEKMLSERLQTSDKSTMVKDNSNIMAIISRQRECADVVTMAWEDYRSK